MGMPTVLFCFGMAFVVFCCICIFLLLHTTPRQEITNRLAANIMVFHALFTLFTSSGALHIDVYGREVSKEFCWVNAYLDIMYLIFVPVSLLVFTVDKLIYIKDPIGYTQKVSKIGVIIMLVFPWVFSALISVITVIAAYDHVNVQMNVDWTHEPEIRNGCFFAETENGLRIEAYVTQAFMGIQWLISLVCTVTVLVMWCCFKRQHRLGTDYSLMGAEVVRLVKYSVIAVCVINIAYIPICFYFWTMVDFHNAIFGSVSPLGVFGTIEGIVFICTSIGVREVITHYCCSCRKNPGKPSVNYNEADKAVHMSS